MEATVPTPAQRVGPASDRSAPRAENPLAKLGCTSRAQAAAIVAAAAAVTAATAPSGPGRTG